MSRSQVVRRGRIKVDARRAVAKLRDHLLLDPDTWPLEVVRVAVMGGATSVRVEHDADDLRLSFDGEPPASDALGRLLDHALDSSRDERTRRLRLLAIAVNASLSGGPAGVEVAVRAEGGQAMVASFDPSIVRAGDDLEPGADDPAGRPEVTMAPASRLRGGSTAVAMRKGFGWGTFVRFATGRSLREARLLAEATTHAPIEVTIDPPIPVPRPTPLLRLDLEPHGVPGAVLEVLAEWEEGMPRVTFLELGVALAHVALPATGGVPTEASGIPLPVRVRVDARQWATNASRSQIDEREARRVLEGVTRAVPAAARALGRAAGLLEEEVAGVVGATEDAGAAERALSAFAVCAAAATDARPLSFVLDLPLVRDAIGRRRSARDLVSLVQRVAESAGVERLHVHRGEAPLPEEFGPFAEEVPWLRGHPLERLLRGVSTRDFEEVHAEVARGIRRREALLELPATEPHVPPGPRELFRARFSEVGGDLAGLHGEIVVHLRSERPLLRVFLEGRPFATFHADTTLPLDAAVAWPGRLRADLAYVTLVADGRPQAVARAVVERAATELSARADALSADDAPEAARALGRSALASSGHARSGPLAVAALWPTAAGPRTSLRAIDAATREGAVCFVQRAPDRPTAAVDGRLVLVLDGADAARLTAALLRDVTLVPYGPGLLRAEGRSERVQAAHAAIMVRELEAQGVESSFVVALESPGSRSLVATARDGVLIRTHAGVVLYQGPSPVPLPAIVIVEEDAIVPHPGWDGVLSPPAPDVDARVVHLLAAVAGTVTSSASRVSLAPRIADADADGARPWAAAALAAVQRAGGKSPARDALRELPVAWVLDESGRPAAASLARIQKAHGRGPAPYLRAAPDFPTHDWLPLLIERRDEIGPLATALGMSLEDAEPQLGRRREIARIERARQEVLARPLEKLLPPVPGALPGSPTAQNDVDGAARTRSRSGKSRGARGEGGGGARGVRALVGLREGPGSVARCVVRYAGRWLADLEIDGVPSLAAVVDVPAPAHVERWTTLSATGRQAAQRAIVDAARTLAERLVGESDDAPLATSPLGQPGALALVAALLREHPPLVTALRLSSVKVPGVFGEAVPLARALHGEGPITVARERFPAELAAEVADPPILLGPSDAPLEALLSALGPALDDVTPALRRIADPGGELPARLDGTPLHPALRARLEDLGVSGLEGEIEITDELTSTVRIALHDGSVRTIAPSLPFSIRVEARPTRLDTRGRALRDAAETVAAAALQLLEATARRLDELPPLARRAVRHTVIATCGRGEQPRKDLARAAAFPDVAGRWRSLAELQTRKVRATTDPPPYPATAFGAADQPPALQLATGDVAVLRKAGVRIFDVTRDLRVEAEAEARARAPRVPAVLDAATRSRCLAVDTFEEGPCAGEVGLLAGSAAAEPRITVLLDRRPLCTLAAPAGWPIAAVWNDDRLKPNRPRDGLAPASQADAIIASVTARRAALMSAALQDAPRHARAVAPVDRAFRGLRVFGRFWRVDDGVPVETRVRWSGLGVDPGVTLFSQAAPAGYPPNLPVGGDVFVIAEGQPVSWDPSHAAALSRMALDMLPSLLPARSGAAGDDGGRCVWHAAILGAAISAPTVRDASGRERVASEVLGELRRRNGLWFTSHAGVALGDFPSDAPAFVLLDDGSSPLLGLLSERAPTLLRELGGLRLDASPDEDEGDHDANGGRAAAGGGPPDTLRSPGKKARRRRSRDARPAPPPRRSAHDAAAPPTPRVVSPARYSPEAAAEAPAPSGPSWLARVGAGMKDLLRGGPRTAISTTDELRVTALDAARRVGVEPAPEVMAVTKGRPVRYDAAANEVLIAVDHPSIRALVERQELEQVAAAVIAEINRALPTVGDVEELAALTDLLEARAQRA